MDTFMNFHLGSRRPRPLDQTMLSVFRRLIERGEFDCESLYWDMCSKDYWYPDLLAIVEDQLWPPIPQRPLKDRLQLALTKKPDKRIEYRLAIFKQIVGKTRFGMDVLAEEPSIFIALMEILGAAVSMDEWETLEQLRILLHAAIRSQLDLSE